MNDEIVACREIARRKRQQTESLGNDVPDFAQTLTHLDKTFVLRRKKLFGAKIVIRKKAARGSYTRRRLGQQEGVGSS
jgi:hypothetical protein